MTSGDRITIPNSWPGNEPEYYVYWALTKLEVEFEYQSDIAGGRTERGGVVVDFYIPSLGLAINVQSTYWHYANPKQRVNDQLNRLMIEGTGVQVVYIDEEAARTNPIYYVREALRGIDHSRLAR